MEEAAVEEEEKARLNPAPMPTPAGKARPETAEETAAPKVMGRERRRRVREKVKEGKKLKGRVRVGMPGVAASPVTQGEEAEPKVLGALPLRGAEPQVGVAAVPLKAS